MMPKVMVEGLRATMQRAHHEIFVVHGDNTTQLVPVMFLVKDTGTTVLELPDHLMGSDHGKDIIAATMPSFLQANKVCCYGIALEVWMTAVEKGVQVLRPSKSDRRKEMILTSIRHVDGTCLESMRELIRDATGKVVELGPDQFANRGTGDAGTTTMAGRFSNLFKAPRHITYEEIGLMNTD